MTPPIGFGLYILKPQISISAATLLAFWSQKLSLPAVVQATTRPREAVEYYDL